MCLRVVCFPLSPFVCFILQEQAHKTVQEISLLVPLLISPLHEGIHNQASLLDLQLNKSASKDQRVTCMRMLCSGLKPFNSVSQERRSYILCQHKSEYSESIYLFTSSINNVFILDHFMISCNYVFFFIIIHSHCHRADR